MNGISQDPATRRWKIESGATVGEMYVGMYTQGKVTIPAHRARRWASVGTSREAAMAF